MISKQNPLRYRTATKLGLIPMEYGKFSSVLASYLKVNKGGKYKLENEHHSGACYLYLPKPIGNASCHPSLWIKPRSNTKIYTSILHGVGHSITDHLSIWIETGGLKTLPNSPMYTAYPLSTIKQSSSIDMTDTLMTAHLYIWITETSNPSY